VGLCPDPTGELISLLKPLVARKLAAPSQDPHFNFGLSCLGLWPFGASPCFLPAAFQMCTSLDTFRCYLKTHISSRPSNPQFWLRVTIMHVYKLYLLTCVLTYLLTCLLLSSNPHLNIFQHTRMAWKRVKINDMSISCAVLLCLTFTNMYLWCL